jgi:hypothetical protein
MTHYDFWKEQIGKTLEFRRCGKPYGKIMKSATIKKVKKEWPGVNIHYLATFDDESTMDLVASERTDIQENSFYQNVIERTYSYYTDKAYGCDSWVVYPLEEVLKKDGTIKKWVNNTHYGRVYLYD